MTRDADHERRLRAHLDALAGAAVPRPDHLARLRAGMRRARRRRVAGVVVVACLAMALGAAGVAAFPRTGSDPAPTTSTQPVAPRPRTLVAAVDAGQREDWALERFDTATGARIRALTGHPTRVASWTLRDDGSVAVRMYVASTANGRRSRSAPPEPCAEADWVGQKLRPHYLTTYVLLRPDGTRVDLGPLRRDAGLHEATMAFSPDGRLLAFISRGWGRNTPECPWFRMAVHRVGATIDPVPLTEERLDALDIIPYSDPSFSPDGRHVFFPVNRPNEIPDMAASGRTPSRPRLVGYVLDLSGAAPSWTPLLTQRPDPTCWVQQDLAFGPDPSWLSGVEACGDRQARRYLVQVDAATGGTRRLAELPGGAGATWIDYDAPRANLMIELRHQKARLVWDGRRLTRLPQLDAERGAADGKPPVLWRSEW